MAPAETSRTIDTAGTRFYARQSGDRPGLVMLHGFGSDLSTWDGLLAALDGELPTLRYDLRGFGQTDHGQGKGFSHAADLLAVLDAVGLDRVDLLGVSMGGSAALNFALEQPARVRRLLLISPGLLGWEWSEEWQAMWKRIEVCARAGDLDRARRLWWQHPLFATTRESQGAAALFDTIMRFSGDQWIADDHRPVYPDIERVFELSMPALLLTGSRDMADFRLIADLLEGAVPTLQRIDFPGLGHLLHLEAPERCAVEILDFLRA